MNKKILVCLVALLLTAIIFMKVGQNGNDASKFKPLEIEIGTIFTHVEYEKPMYVLNYLIEEVNGDEGKEMIILVGEKAESMDEKAANIDIVIYEQNSKKFYPLNLKNFDGELPVISAIDLTGDGINDIVATAKNDNGELSTRVISYIDLTYTEILKEKDNKGIQFFGYFIDGFKAYVKCPKYNKEINVDLADRKENYITQGFFDDSGRLLSKETKIYATKICSIEFVNLTDYYGIQTTQRIIGFNNDDFLDEITVIWKYEDGKWKIKEAKGKNFWNLLYLE